MDQPTQPAMQDPNEITTRIGACHQCGATLPLIGDYCPPCVRAQQQPNAETQAIMRWADDDREELAYAIVDEVYEYAAWIERMPSHGMYTPRIEAALALNRWLTDRDPLRNTADVVYSELMTQAIARVDWLHIVDYLRRRMTEEAAALAQLQASAQDETRRVLTRIAEQEPAIHDLLTE